MSVYLLLPLLTVAVAFYDPMTFSLSKCAKLLRNANEFGRLFHHSCSRFVAIRQILTAVHYSADTMHLNAA